MDMTPDEYITELVIECENRFERFWERNIDRISDVDISDLRIMAFAVHTHNGHVPADACDRR